MPEEPSDDVPTVAVVGSTMIDMVTYLNRYPQPGETVIGESFVIGFGGKGANQAVMAVRLSARVAFIGCVGDDAHGEMVRTNLTQHGVDTTALARRTGSTGVAPIWVEPDGTNRIVIVPGANSLLSADAAAAAVQALDRVDVVVGQMEVPQDATMAGFTAGRARGARTVLNPAPYADLDPALVAVCDWLVPNETEFALLAARCLDGAPSGPDASARFDSSARLDASALLDSSARPGASERPSMSAPPDGSARPAAVDHGLVREVAAALGCSLVVTAGADGVIVAVDGDVHRIAVPRVEAVDTTGAGDAFVGAFAVGLAEGADPLAAARLAAACATASVQRHGTQTSFPSREEVQALRLDRG